MPYAGGTWGEKGKLRSKKRLEYFREYRRRHPQKYKYKYKQRYGKTKGILGYNIPKDINLNLLIKEKGLKCQLCGKLPTLKKCKLRVLYTGLLIHHKDGDIKNNKFENLMIVCRGCHNKIHHTGKQISKEHRKRVSESNVRRKFSEETKRKMREHHKGFTRPHTDEEKRKISKAIKKWHKRKRGEIDGVDKAESQ